MKERKTTAVEIRVRQPSAMATLAAKSTPKWAYIPVSLHGVTQLNPG